MIQTLFGSLDEVQKPSFIERMKEAVSRTRENLAERIEDVVSIGKEIDRSTLDDLEATLIGADLGTTTTHEVLEKLRDKADRKQIKDVNELKRLLKEELLAILTSTGSQPVTKVDGTPEVIIVVGVNGTGKTTTIGKLAQVFRAQGKTVLLCAADTFRAAAIEQLEIWGQRTGTEVIKTKAGGDPSAVLFDALQAATARKTDYVIVDTAGRLHTKQNLMLELEKMKRTAQRIVPGAPHETLLVMDATTGQNGLQQARQFTQSSGVTGIVLTKLDGTAKGGVVVAISRELGLPVRYVGVGEKAGDLLPFDAKEFVESLFCLRSPLRKHRRKTYLEERSSGAGRQLLAKLIRLVRAYSPNRRARRSIRWCSYRPRDGGPQNRSSAVSLANPAGQDENRSFRLESVNPFLLASPYLHGRSRRCWWRNVSGCHDNRRTTHAKGARPGPSGRRPRLAESRSGRGCSGCVGPRSWGRHAHL